MRCRERGCRGQLRVTHTYSEDEAKHQRAVCAACGAVHCLTTFAQLVTRPGQGARARAAQAAREARRKPERGGPF